jgi:putative transposase
LNHETHAQVAISRSSSTVLDESETWRTRDLSGVALDYLFLDGSPFKFHPGVPAEPVLCAWGISTERAPIFVGLAPWASESYEAWADFLSDLTGRGLTPPLLAVSDGAPRLIGAAKQVLAKSLRQRCLIHRARNVLAKVPTAAQAEVKAEYWKIFDDLDADPGQAAVDVLRDRLAAFEKRYGTTYPAAVKC